MKPRKRRWLFNLFAALSLLLFLITAAAWGDTYWHQILIDWHGARFGRGVNVMEGEVCLFKTDESDDSVHQGSGFEWGWYEQDVDTFSSLPFWDESRMTKSWVGIRWEQSRIPGPEFILTIPVCYLAGIFALAPLGWLLAQIPLRTRKRPPGLCLTCSYDLRAHKPGQKCPECGTVLPASGEAQP